MKIKKYNIKGTGVLPFTIHNDKLFFLLGQEKKINNWEGSCKWSDFGGKLEKGLTFQENAIKELTEESFGVLGKPKNKYIEKLDDSMHIVLQGYVCWLVYVPYKDYPKMFQTLSKIRSSSFQLDDLIDGLNLHFRNYILALTPDGETLMNLNESHKKEYVDTMSSWDLNDILQIINQFNKLRHTIKNSHQPLIAFEILSLKLMEMDKSVIISDLLAENSSNNSANDKQFAVEQKNVGHNNTKELDTTVKPKENNSINETSIKIEDISHEKNAEPQPKVKNIGLDEIKDKCQDFIKIVNSERPSLGSTLDHSIPTNIKDNQLTITVSGLPEFSVNNLNHNKELIQKSLSTFYGNEYVLFFSWDSKNSNDVNLANSEPEVREDSKDADKVVEKIIEEFDGEILR